MSDAELVLRIEDLIEEAILIDPDEPAAGFADRISVAQLVLAGIIAGFAESYGEDAARQLTEQVSGSMAQSVADRLRAEVLN